MIRRLAVVALLLLLVPAQGNVEQQQVVAVSPSTMAPPVTLGSLHANTVVDPSGTSATTSSAISLPIGGLGTVSPLKLVHGTVAQDVVMTVVSKSGLAGLDSVTVTLGAASVAIGSGTSVPVSSSQVDIGTVTDITLTAAGICLGTCTLGIEFRINPDGADDAPVIKYSYTLLVT